MGATIMTALLFWGASSYVEYKIIHNIPRLKVWFDNQVIGIVMSILIGTTVAYILGIPNGIGAALGQLMGLATNQLTYNFFDRTRRTHEFVKTHKATVTEFYSRNETLCKEAAQTLKGGLITIGAIITFFIMVIGLPYRLYEKFRTWRGGAYDIA